MAVLLLESYYPAVSSEPVSSPTIVAGRYELVRLLGQGAFGCTYLARDRTLERSVALKVLDPRTTADWKAFDRFEREAAVLRSLRHHGIPEVHDLIQDEWQGGKATFLIMEYIEGVSLQQAIDDRLEMDSADIVAMFLDQLTILEYLHGRVPPILHRDIKPTNIILRPNDQPALVDFGSVRHVFMEPDESGSTIAGTYGYMPYEQYMGQATPASDLYALGATFLHLLTGRPPKDFMTSEGRIGVPATLPVDARMRAILARLLLPSPAERFQSARDVRHALLGTASIAVVGSGTGSLVGVSPRPPVVTPAPLVEPVPRPKRDTEKLLKEIAPSALQLMDGSTKPADRPGVLDWFVVGFFSVLTAGVLPMVFASMARARRRRLRKFLRDGLPTIGEILSIEIEKAAFDSTIARVGYQFQADGELYRDTDQMLPMIAGRWRPGDHVQVLYLPQHNYDSVIIPKI
jgi:serine/threonine protein kinase